MKTFSGFLQLALGRLIVVASIASGLTIAEPLAAPAPVAKGKAITTEAVNALGGFPMSTTGYKYDDASWHYGGDFPEDLPDSAGGTHIAMFVVWSVLHGMAGELNTSGSISELRCRTVSPTTWFLAEWDEKFTNEVLNDEGNAFAHAYYEAPDANSYFSDYAEIFSELPSIYHAPDTWATFDKLSPKIQQRFESWQINRSK
jgi:hypothetical protein